MKGFKLLCALLLGLSWALTACGDDPAQNMAGPDANFVTNYVTEQDPTPAEMSLAEAERSGAATVTLSGIDLEHVKVTLTASRMMKVKIPVGLLLVSGDGGTQNMMLAKSVEIELHGTQDMPDMQEVVIPAYCVNRFLSTPSPASNFSLGTIDEQMRPLEGLAACLEKNAATAREKQFAIWALSREVVNLSADAFAARLVDDTRADIIRLGPDGFAEKAVHEKGAPPEFAAMIRAMSQSELLEWFDEDREEWLASGRSDYENMRAAAKPLLEACGHDLSTLPMFANA